jgi:hypothetical protein
MKVIRDVRSLFFSRMSLLRGCQSLRLHTKSGHYGRQTRRRLRKGFGRSTHHPTPSQVQVGSLCSRGRETRRGTSFRFSMKLSFTTALRLASAQPSPSFGYWARQRAIRFRTRCAHRDSTTSSREQTASLPTGIVSDLDEAGSSGTDGESPLARRRRPTFTVAAKQLSSRSTTKKKQPTYTTTKPALRAY